jgi:glycosyltransferase involved in cell wall biosynthesis
MKLLVVTQTVDCNDPLLGFFHHWIEELAKRAERIEVLCLFEGEHALPANVRVHSLGKPSATEPTQGVGKRIRYAWNFLKLIRRLHHGYDSVFVHMNPVYVVIGGLWWRAWGKRIALWYNHPHDYLLLRLAHWLSDTVFYTSPHAAAARFRNAERMPAGIDTDIFSPSSITHDRMRIHLQGRIMPSKRIEVALAAVRILRQRVPEASLVLVGPEHREYAKKLRADFNDLIVESAVLFLGSKKNEETPALYRIAGAALNLAQAGHFDKTVFEAMACETPPIVGAAGWEDILPPECIVPQNDPQALAEAVERLIKLPEEEYRALGKQVRKAVIEKHSLRALMDALAAKL